MHFIHTLQHNFVKQASIAPFLLKGSFSCTNCCRYSNLVDGSFPKSFGYYFTCQSGTELVESVCKAEAKLGRRFDKPSVCHAQANAQVFYWQFCQVAAAQSLLQVQGVTLAMRRCLKSLNNLLPPWRRKEETFCPLREPSVPFFLLFFNVRMWPCSDEISASAGSTLVSRASATLIVPFLISFSPSSGGSKGRLQQLLSGFLTTKWEIDWSWSPMPSWNQLKMLITRRQLMCKLSYRYFALPFSTSCNVADFLACLSVFDIWVGGDHRRLARILSTHETQNGYVENVTRVYIHKAVTDKWVKYQCWVNYPFSELVYCKSSTWQRFR